MKTEFIPTEISLEKAKKLNPLLVSRTALDIFPAAVASDMPMELLIGTTCRNLLFYELQLLSVRYGADNISDPLASLSIYTTELAVFLLNAEVLPLLVRRISCLRNMEEVRKMQNLLKGLPEVPSDAPADILLIQEMLRELHSLFVKPCADIIQKYQQLTVRWMRCQTMLPMQSIRAESVLDLALYQIQRNLSRYRCGEERRLEWGKEIHGYYHSYLSSGYCAQTAKRLARADFIKAHPIPIRAEDQLSLAPQPGLHRNSIRFYHKSYQESEKNRARTQIKERQEK